MSTIKFRPTFSFPIEQDSEELFWALRRAVDSQSNLFVGRFTKGHAMISFVVEKRHFWSPWLNLEIRETEVGRQLFGRFSPHPSIWTGFMLTYLALSVLTFFSVVLGLSQQLVSQWPWGFVFPPIWIAIAIALWIASQAGQRLSFEEMETLKSMVETVATKPD